jgi:hypothetical protein
VTDVIGERNSLAGGLTQRGSQSSDGLQWRVGPHGNGSQRGTRAVRVTLRVGSGRVSWRVRPAKENWFFFFSIRISIQHRSQRNLGKYLETSEKI